MGSEYLATIDRGRTTADTAAILQMSPAFEFEQPHHLEWPFRMRQPIGLGLVATPEATLIVADASDIALHRFAVCPPTYLRSHYFGGRDSSLIARLASMTVSQSGDIAIGDIGRSQILLLAPSGRLQSVIRLEGISEEWSAARIGIGEDGRVFERALATPESRLRNGLVRVWNAKGQLLAPIGRMQPFGARRFTIAANDGTFVLRGDTLWYARFVDGRILGWLTTEDRTAPVRIIELPLYFEIDVPTYDSLHDPSDLNGGILPVRIQRHISSFAIDPSGNVFAGQHLRDGRLVLSAVSNDGKRHLAFDLGGKIRALAATEDAVYAALEWSYPTGIPTTRVLAFSNPFCEGGDQCQIVEKCQQTRPKD